MTTNPNPWAYDVHGFLKPKFRGIVHLCAIVPVLLGGITLTAFAPTTGTKVTLAIYTMAITGMLTSSATYHRAHVSDRVRTWLRRLDHSMIGVAVAGTYTPVIALVLDGALRTTLLTLLWTGALGSLIVSFAFPHAPRLVRALVYIFLGWGGAIAMPWLWTHAGVTAFVLVMIGAAFYTAGAIIYAKRRPNPWPAVFGFHEIFHTLVLLAVLTHFAAVALVVHNVA